MRQSKLKVRSRLNAYANTNGQRKIKGADRQRGAIHGRGDFVYQGAESCTDSNLSFSRHIKCSRPGNVGSSIDQVRRKERLMKGPKQQRKFFHVFQHFSEVPANIRHRSGNSHRVRMHAGFFASALRFVP